MIQCATRLALLILGTTPFYQLSGQAQSIIKWLAQGHNASGCQIHDFVIVNQKPKPLSYAPYLNQELITTLYADLIFLVKPSPNPRTHPISCSRFPQSFAAKLIY